MKVIVASEKVAQALPSKLFGSKTRNEVIRLIADNEALTLQGAAYLGSVFRASVPAQVLEQGEVVVDAKFFRQLISAFKFHEIELSKKENDRRLTLRCNTDKCFSEYKIPCFDDDAEPSKEIIGQFSLEEAEPVLTVNDDLLKTLTRLRPFLSSIDACFIITPEDHEHVRLFAIQSAIAATTTVYAESFLKEGDGLVLPDTAVASLTAPSVISRIRRDDELEALVTVHEYGFVAHRTFPFSERANYARQVMNFLNTPAQLEFSPSWNLLYHLKDILKIAPPDARRRHRTRILWDFKEQKVKALAVDYYSDATELFVSSEFPTWSSPDGKLPKDQIVISAELLTLALQFVPRPERFEFFISHSVPILRIVNRNDAVVVACMKTEEEQTPEVQEVGDDD